LNVLSAITSDKDVLRYVADKALEGLPRSRGQLSKMAWTQDIGDLFLQAIERRAGPPRPAFLR
jgi:hypothetical protein